MNNLYTTILIFLSTLIFGNLLITFVKENFNAGAIASQMSQDDTEDKEHDDAKELGAKLSGKLEESKQVLTESPQRPKDIKETNN